VRVCIGLRAGGELRRVQNLGGQSLDLGALMLIRELADPHLQTSQEGVVLILIMPPVECAPEALAA
jgi:hypothetical protein